MLTCTHGCTPLTAVLGWVYQGHSVGRYGWEIVDESMETNKLKIIHTVHTTCWQCLRQLPVQGNQQCRAQERIPPFCNDHQDTSQHLVLTCMVEVGWGWSSMTHASTADGMIESGHCIHPFNCLENKCMRKCEVMGTRVLLFGTAKKPMGMRASQCARQTEFFTFPGQMYNRWNSSWPVALDVSVLSLPRITGTIIAPWRLGSSPSLS